MTDAERAVVQVRLTARNLKRVEALAAHDQLTTSEFVRRLIHREMGEERATNLNGTPHDPG